MKIIKEYNSEQTKIRIHDDYLQSNEKNPNTKEVIISLVLNYLIPHIN